MSNTSNKILGFIGAGVMGGSMAEHLIDAGYEVHVYSRTKNKADKLIVKGGIWEDSPADIATKCDIVFTIVGFPEDVEEIYLSDNGLVFNARIGTLLVDMTTSSPVLARKIYDVGKKRGLGVLDAPVTGGDRGAREATLTIFVGGDKADYDIAENYLKIMGRIVKHEGPSGSGQNAKLANQIAITGTMTGMCEAFAFAESCGLDLHEFLDAVSGGAASSWSLVNYGPRILQNDFEPGFFVKHYVKDLKLAERAAKEMEINLPALALTRKLYEKLMLNGYQDKGTQSLFCLYSHDTK